MMWVDALIVLRKLRTARAMLPIGCGLCHVCNELLLKNEQVHVLLSQVEDLIEDAFVEKDGE